MKTSADELDQQIESLISGRGGDHDGDSNSLLAVATELRSIPDPDFKRRLMAELVGEAVPFETAYIPQGTMQRETAALSSIMPTLSGKGLGIFPADHRSFLVSFASHAALVLLIASGIFVGQRAVVKTPSLMSELTFPLAGHGGGGSGDRSTIPVSKGTPPKFSDQQTTPPAIVVRNPNPRLSVRPTVLGPPDIKLPQSNQLGDLMSSNIVMPSNGTGAGGAAGNGSGTGVGIGKEGGVGTGANGGYGIGIFRPGLGVTAPRAIYDPDPEYSEEARKVHHQGTVTLALIVDTQGHAHDIRVMRSLGMGLDEKAVEAVRKWRFQPGTKDGQAVATQVDIEVNFRLY
jgi:protein TonB